MSPAAWSWSPARVMIVLASLAAHVLARPRSASANNNPSRSASGRYVVKPQEIHPLYHPEQQYEGQKCPRYYILGQMKCGTTTLWKHAKSGLVFPHKADMPKAIHVMDSHEALLQLKFKHVAIPVLEATPSYIRGLDPALRIKNYCNFTDGRPKFVVTLCDPTNRTWSHFKHEEFSDQDHSSSRFGKGRKKLTDKTLPGAYRRCIEQSLPLIDECLSKFSYEQCWRLLYHNSAPGSHDVPDAWGMRRPCHGALFSSLYAEELGYWTSVFPRGDFLVVYRDNWLADPVSMVKAMGRHFGVPRSSTRINTKLSANYHSMFEKVVPPADVQAKLTEFFKRHSGWKEYIKKIGSATTLRM